MLVVVVAFFCGLFSGTGESRAADRRGTAGPYVTYDQKSPGTESIGFDGGETRATSQRSGTTGKVMFPVDAFGVLVVPQFGWVEERRQYSKLEGGFTAPIPTHSRALTPGIATVARGLGGGWAPFAAYNRHSAFTKPEQAGAMDELYLGTSGQLGTDSRFIVGGRVRRFPYITRGLPIFGVDMWFDDWSLGVDVLYPSHALIRYRWVEEIVVSTGIEVQGRDRPFDMDGQGLWVEGYTASGVVSFAKPIWKVLYGEWAIGAQQEKLTVYGDDGETRARLLSSPAPWVRVALRTFFP